MLQLIYDYSILTGMSMPHDLVILSHALLVIYLALYFGYSMHIITEQLHLLYIVYWKCRLIEFYLTNYYSTCLRIYHGDWPAMWYDWWAINRYPYVVMIVVCIKGVLYNTNHVKSRSRWRSSQMALPVPIKVNILKSNISCLTQPLLLWHLYFVTFRVLNEETHHVTQLN